MKFIFLVLMACPALSFSQGVKVNVYDKFIKQQRIELEPLMIPAGGKDKVGIAFSSIASTFYLQLSGSGWGASTIDVDNPLIFLFSNDSTVTLRSTSLQTFEPGLAQSTYRHQYYINAQEVEAFSQYDLVGIRKYSFKDFTDLSIPRTMVPKIKDFGALFLRELKKANVIKTLKNISVKDVAKYVGDSVAFCSHIYTTRYYENSENKPTVLDMRSSFSEPLVNVIIRGEDRALFNFSPEKIYANRDMCITGVVELKNGTPQVILKRREQIKIASPIKAADAPYFVGDSVTITGKIFSGRYLSETESSPTILNMGAAYPNDPITLVIEKNNRDYFVNQPEKLYVNKNVSVSGTIVLFKNKPQIILRNSAQIKIIDERATATSGVF